jgi:two-component sensor histidine kinase
MTAFGGGVCSAIPLTKFSAFILFLILGFSCQEVSADRLEEKESGTAVVDLQEIKRDDDDDGTPDMIGDTVRVAGISNIGSGILHEQYLQVFIQNDGYGLSLFSDTIGQPVSPGDSIVATGVVQEYFSLTEVNVVAYKVYPTESKTINTQPLANAMGNLKRYEGMLVGGTGTVIDKGSRYNGKYLLITPNGSEDRSIMVYVTNFHTAYKDFDFESITEGDQVKVTGVLTKYSPTPVDDGILNYKIHLRTPADFSIVGLSFNQMILGGTLGLAMVLLVVGWIVSLRSTVKNKTRELERSLHDKEILLKEIHHRVKNNLAIMSGLFELQLDSTNSEETIKALRNSQSRLQSMALVHDKLYQTSSLSEIEMNHYIPELVESLRDSFRNSEQQISLNFDIQEDLRLDIDHAIPCGLLINEVVVNAFKHAFSRDIDASISVSMHQTENQLTLIIADNGRGLPDDFAIAKSTSLGMMLIDTFRDQLGATLDISADNGTRYTLTFTLD